MNNNEINYRAQFNSIYRQYYSTVYKNILYFTGDTHTAEDLTQETFIKLYNSPPEHTNIVGWLTRVSANLSYNYLRNRKARSSKEGVFLGEDEGISIEDAAIKNCEIESIRKALDNIADRDRMCLLLKYSGYKYDEIADIIKVNKVSVGSMIARAQARFKEYYLKEYGDFKQMKGVGMP